MTAVCLFLVITSKTCVELIFVNYSQHCILRDTRCGRVYTRTSKESFFHIAQSINHVMNSSDGIVKIISPFLTRGSVIDFPSCLSSCMIIFFELFTVTYII